MDIVNLRYVMVNHPRVADSLAHSFLQRQILGVIEHFRQKHGLPPLAELQDRN